MEIWLVPCFLAAPNSIYQIVRSNNAIDLKQSRPFDPVLIQALRHRILVFAFCDWILWWSHQCAIVAVAAIGFAASHKSVLPR
jgi:hypothetical protein